MSPEPSEPQDKTPPSAPQGEEKIEDVLREMKQGLEAAPERELKNLKKVLESADAQAGAELPAAAPAPAQPSDAKPNNEPVFSEKFLQLEAMIKKFKAKG